MLPARSNASARAGGRGPEAEVGRDQEEEQAAELSHHLEVAREIAAPMRPEKPLTDQVHHPDVPDQGADEGERERDPRLRIGLGRMEAPDEPDARTPPITVAYSPATVGGNSPR